MEDRLYKTSPKGCSQTGRFKRKEEAKKPIKIFSEDPFKKPPPYEKLLGDISGAYSRRINIQHRLVYQILEDIKTIKVIRIWTHDE